MNEHISAPVAVFFAFTTLLTVFIFYKATRRSQTSLFILLGWLAIQAAVSLSGFYVTENTIPPRMALLAGPALLFIAGLFLTVNGRAFLDTLNLQTLTWLHTVRIAVELVLYWLFLSDAVPQLITFAGRNFDILAGLTAPLAVYFGFSKPSLKKTFLVTWNILCLVLLVNIVSLAVLSAPTPLQQFAFGHPNAAILYFPFTWLPCCVVPLVLLSHLASLRLLLKKN